MAKNAAPEIRDAIQGSDKEPALSLEDHLRTQYRDSADPLDQRRFFSIALYLQHVLWEVSRYEDAHFDNLDRLINRLLRVFDHVCFVTLNYDLLLDRCLASLARLTSLRHFISHERWSLIKLHGSVTWGREITDAAGLDLSNPPADLAARLADPIYHRWSLRLETLREGSDQNRSFNVFPALTVPIGSEDEIVCPSEHQNFLDDRLHHANPVDLLVIGYSGIDNAVIKKLWPARGKVRSLTVVNAGERQAIEVAQRLSPDLGLDVYDAEVSVSKEPFSAWVRSELPRWASEVGAG